MLIPNDLQIEIGQRFWVSAPSTSTFLIEIAKLDPEKPYAIFGRCIGSTSGSDYSSYSFDARHSCFTFKYLEGQDKPRE